MTMRGVHRVGVTAAAVGFGALAFGAFGVFSAFRIASGTGLRLFEALPPQYAVMPLVLWFGIVALSLPRSRSATLALARGWLAAVTVVATLWLVGISADRWVEPGDTVARFAVGGGAWLSTLAAFALFTSSRREARMRPEAVRAMTAALPIGVVVLVVSGALRNLGMAAEYRNISGEFWGWVALHLALSGGAVAVATVIATWLGVIAYRRPKVAEPLLTVTALFQTIPGLAMIGLLAVPLTILVKELPWVRRAGIGTIGWAPVAIALTLYALLVIARTTYAGLRGVSAEVVEAGVGMGMSRRQVLARIEMPLAAPVLFSGIRTAVQQTIGNATLGVFVAAATLGRPIFGGVSQTANDLTLLGSVALVALALTSDTALRGAERLVTPRHLRGGRR